MSSDLQGRRDDPASTAAQAFQAFNSRDWDTFADYVDPVDVQAWYGELLVVTSATSGSEAAKQLHRHLPAVSGGDELREMSPRDALVAFLRAQDPLEKLESMEGAEALQEYGLADAVLVTRTLIGVLVENASTAHVLYRTAGSVVDPQEVHTTTLRRTNDRWYVSMRGELFDHSDIIAIDAVGDDERPPS